MHFLADQLKRQLSNALDKVSSEHLGTSDDVVGSSHSKSPLSSTTPDLVGAPAASHRRLHNLDLLKQYLMFVAQETCIDIQHDDNEDCGEQKIVIGIPKENQKKEYHVHPGARLIESYVHGPSKMASVIEGKLSFKFSLNHHKSPADPKISNYRSKQGVFIFSYYYYYNNNNTKAPSST